MCGRAHALTAGVALAVAVAGQPFGTAGVSGTTSEGRALRVPLGLDLYVPFPADNPIRAAKVELGRRLFFETRLSADGRTSCATCHQPERAFTDGRRVPRGVFGRAGQRNAPSILNRAYGLTAFWDGRAGSLEEQVVDAAAARTDLGLSVGQGAERIAGDSAYRSTFSAAYGDGTVTAERVVQALATFVRAQLSGDSPYDRYVAGDRGALTAEAQRGLALFTGSARCARCHSGPLLADEEFHNTGVSWGTDPGRYAVTGASADRGRFKTPSLRNVALTAPYMHDGSMPDLQSVVDFYAAGGGQNPNLSDDLRPVPLTPTDRAALIAFLTSLTAER